MLLDVVCCTTCGRYWYGLLIPVEITENNPMKAYLLAGVLALLSAPTIGDILPWNATEDIRHTEQHAALKRDLRTQNPQILFLGDSLTARWLYTGRPFWDANFAPLGAVDVGIEGERTQGLLWRIQDGEFQGIAPKQIVLLIGTNNIGYPAEDISRGIIAVIGQLHAAIPGAQIIVLGVLPREAPESPSRLKVTKVNALVNLAVSGQFPYAIFLDIGEVLLDTHGAFRPGFMMPDLVHMLAPAYDAIGARLLPELQKRK